LTTDNEPAEITIGENIPFQGSTNAAAALSSQAGAAAGLLGALGQNVQRQDVGLKLKITPHVNDSDYVRLEIDQESSKVLQLNAGGLGPSWGKRSVKTTVVVRDQQPVVIGGLMDDDVKIVESKVPLLGDIPILGYLFKFQRKEKKKTNLLIFLTPYVIKDQGDIERIFEKKTRERQEFLETFTSFRDENFTSDVNYGRKRGLLEEINQSVKRAEADARMFREAEQQTRAIEGDGPVDLDAPAGEPSPPPAVTPGDAAPGEVP
jgi:general secretion pathway protein D